MTASVYRTSNGDLVPAVVVLNANSDGTIAAAGTGGTPSTVVLGAGTAQVGLVSLHAVTTPGGLASSPVISTATTNAVLVKGTPAGLIGGVFANNGASWIYLKLFNKATAPVPGTDTPTMVIGLAPAATTQLNCLGPGVSFNVGLGLALTGAPALLDATAIASAACVGQLIYN